MSEHEILHLYEYRPLDQESQEIRLVKILPATLDDELELEIFHVPFITPTEKAPDTRLSLGKMKTTIPEQWDVLETLEGRYIFANPEGITQWTHPNSDFEQSLYDCPAVLDPYPDFEPKFEALSYAWGDEEATVGVRITSNTLESFTKSSWTIYIRPNLYAALKHLRQLDAARVLWIDALCINQNDWDERNREVKRMVNIYTLANRVVVWLGLVEADGSSQRGLNILESLGEQIEITKDEDVFIAPASLSTLRTNLPSAYESLRFSLKEFKYSMLEAPLPYNQPDYLAIRRLLDRSWFDRLWILQEIQLARHKTVLLCGLHSASWYFVRRSIIFLNWHKKPEFGDVLPKSLLDRRLGIVIPCSGLSTTGLLNVTRKAEYSVDHDRIFALFGLMPPELVVHIKADYSLPVYQIFRELCLAITKHTKSLMFLKHCEMHNVQDIPMKPSWVPNWLGSPRYMQLGPSNAAGESFASPSIDTNGVALTVHGVLSGSVQFATASAPENGEFAPLLRQWEEVARRSRTDNADETWKKKYMDILRSGYSAEKYPSSYFPSMMECLARYDAAEYASLVHECVRERAFFTTEDGHFGLGPSSMNTGDIIAVLLGLSSPIIFRPSTSPATEVTTYQVVGCAYVQGLENAETLRGPMPAEFKVHLEIEIYGYYRQVFTHMGTGEETCDDPRMGELPDGWVLGGTSEESGRKWYHNEMTGETSWEPRETYEELRKRGVNVREITLV